MLIGRAAIEMTRLVESEFPLRFSEARPEYRLEVEKYDGTTRMNIYVRDLLFAQAYAHMTVREWELSMCHAYDLRKWLDYLYTPDNREPLSRTRFEAKGTFNADVPLEEQFARLAASWMRRVFLADNLQRLFMEHLRASTYRGMSMSAYHAVAATFPKPAWLQPRPYDNTYTTSRAGYNITVAFWPDRKSNTWHDRELLEPDVDVPGSHMEGKIHVISSDDPSLHIKLEFVASDGKIVVDSMNVSTGYMWTPIDDLHRCMYHVRFLFQQIADAAQPFLVKP